jgi:hypothetical protein
VGPQQHLGGSRQGVCVCVCVFECVSECVWEGGREGGRALQGLTHHPHTPFILSSTYPPSHLQGLTHHLSSHPPPLPLTCRASHRGRAAASATRARQAAWRSGEASEDLAAEAAPDVAAAEAEAEAMPAEAEAEAAPAAAAVSVGEAVEERRAGERTHTHVRETCYFSPQHFSQP